MLWGLYPSSLACVLLSMALFASGLSYRDAKYSLSQLRNQQRLLATIAASHKVIQRLLRATMQALLAAARAQSLAELFRALLARALASCRSRRSSPLGSRQQNEKQRSADRHRGPDDGDDHAPKVAWCAWHHDRRGPGPLTAEPDDGRVGGDTGRDSFLNCELDLSVDRVFHFLGKLEGDFL
jgi:hypothetical protein